MEYIKGAVSVHYHVLIPESREFIRGAICLSGSAFLRYAYLDKKSHLKKMLTFAQKINSSIEHVNDLIEFLKHVPSQAIVNETSQASHGMTLKFDWAPILESESLYIYTNYMFKTISNRSLFENAMNSNSIAMLSYNATGKSSKNPILIESPDAMYNHNTNISIDMIFGYTNYVRSMSN